mgnify:CR=1 FL=1
MSEPGFVGVARVVPVRHGDHGRFGDRVPLERFAQAGRHVDAFLREHPHQQLAVPLVGEGDQVVSRRPDLDDREPAAVRRIQLKDPMVPDDALDSVLQELRDDDAYMSERQVVDRAHGRVLEHADGRREELDDVGDVQARERGAGEALAAELEELRRGVPTGGHSVVELPVRALPLGDGEGDDGLQDAVLLRIARLHVFSFQTACIRPLIQFWQGRK